MSKNVSRTWAEASPRSRGGSSWAREGLPCPPALAAWRSSIARGRIGSSSSRIPRAIAPEVTITTSTPSPCSAATSSHTRSSTPGRRSPFASATTEDPSLTTRVGIARLRLGGVEPQREAQQPPQLARVVLVAGDVLVDQPRDRRGLEVALAAQPVGAQDLAGERLARPAAPGGGGGPGARPA